MAKIVTMHQPNYLPWIGLFSKISLAHALIIYDTAQYTTGGIINRNKIRTANGCSYLTIPVRKIYAAEKIIDVPLPENSKWREDHWKTIYQNYTKARFFRDYKDFFENLYHDDFRYLSEINEKIILYILKRLGIKVEVLKASNLGIDPEVKKTEVVVTCMQKAGADIYLSGPSGKNYLEFDKFTRNNIDLKFFNFQHPVYQQRYPGFEPNMSVIDLLFNAGPASEEIVREAGHLEER